MGGYYLPATVPREGEEFEILVLKEHKQRSSSLPAGLKVGDKVLACDKSGIWYNAKIINSCEYNSDRGSYRFLYLLRLLSC